MGTLIRTRARCVFEFVGVTLACSVFVGVTLAVCVHCAPKTCTLRVGLRHGDRAMVACLEHGNGVVTVDFDTSADAASPCNNNIGVWIFSSSAVSAGGSAGRTDGVGVRWALAFAHITVNMQLRGRTRMSRLSCGLNN